jgi:hypothetical protein
MARYITNDGHHLVGENPVEIVRELHKISWTPADNDRAFMRQTAERASFSMGKQIRWHNVDVFVQDLLANGLLVEEDAS